MTGAGRGLGLEFVRLLSQLPAEQVSIVFAAIRSSPSEALQKFADELGGRLVILHMAVTDKSNIATAVEQVRDKLAGQGLDFLINNVGTISVSPEGIVAMDNLMEVVQINVESCLECHICFLPVAERGEAEEALELVSLVVFQLWTIAAD